MLPIGIPRGIRGFALAVGNAFHSDAVGGHLVNLLDGPVRPTKSSKPGFFGFTFGSTSIASRWETRRNPCPSMLGRRKFEQCRWRWKHSKSAFRPGVKLGLAFNEAS